MTLLYARPPFEQLRNATYDLALIDPPWPNYNRSPKGEKKSSVAQYGRMPWEAIYALPVRDLLKRDAAIVLCCTAPMLLNGGDVKRHYAGHDAAHSPQGECLKHWGARPSTFIFWRKLSKNGKPVRGTGYRVWSCVEPFAIGIIGAPKTVVLDNFIEGERRDHSRKPETLYTWCEAFMPGARRIDLFSRAGRAGWDTWGHEAGKFDPVVTHGAPANQNRAAA
jgi:N6-adenosine-specific RNA methylase IME4